MVSKRQLKSYIESDFGYTKAYNTFKKYNPAKPFMRKKAYEAVKADYLGKGTTPKQNAELKRVGFKIKNTLPEKKIKNFKGKSVDKDIRKRITSIKVLHDVRAGAGTLQQLAKQNNISVFDVLRNTRAFKEVAKGEYVPRSSDNIVRKMAFWSNDEKVVIDVKGFESASLIGHYMGAVGNYTLSGNKEYLEPYIGQGVKDVYGNFYVFETDEETLIHLIESQRDEGIIIEVGSGQVV